MKWKKSKLIEYAKDFNKNGFLLFSSFFLLTLCTCMGLYTYSKSTYETHTIYGNTETTQPFDLEKDMVITQEFEAENLRGAGVNFEIVDNIDENPNVNIEIKLFDSDTDIEISSLIFNTIQSGIGPQELMVPSGRVYSKEKTKYRLEIKQLTDNYNNYKISILTEQAPKKDDINIMRINGADQVAKVSITSLVDTPVHFIPFFSFILMITVMATVYLGYKKFALEKIFIIAFIGFGILYSLLMSPFVIPDESTHYDRAYSLSNRILGYEDTMRREEDLSLFTYLHTPDKHTVQNTLDNLFKLSSSNEMVEGTVIHSRFNKVIPYIPSSLGITIGKILHLGAYPMFYLGRLFNLLATAALIYIAIKIVPFGKMILFVTAFLPMTVHLVGSYSYDGLTISSTMLFVSYILYIKYSKKKIEKLDYIALTLLPVIFLSAKSFGYMPFLLLLGILPWKSMLKEDKKNIVAFSLIAIFIYLYTSGTFSLIQNLIFPASENGTGDMIGGLSSEISMHTYADVFRSPIKYIIMVLGTLYRNIEIYIKDMIGNNLCWYTFQVKEFIIYMYAILILFAGLNKDQTIKLVDKDRCLIGLAGISTCGIVVLSMAIAYTPEIMNTVIGVQGRYFIPAIVLVLLFFYDMRIQLKFNLSVGLMYATIFLQIFTVMDIILNIMRI